MQTTWLPGSLLAGIGATIAASASAQTSTCDCECLRSTMTTFLYALIARVLRRERRAVLCAVRRSR